MISMLSKSIKFRIFGGYTGMFAIIMMVVIITIYMIFTIKQNFDGIKSNSEDAILTSRLDIDLTTFNLVFRRFLLTDNDQEEWARAQRIFGGFEGTLEEAQDGLNAPERRAAGVQIGENAAQMRAAAAEIARIKDKRHQLEGATFGEALDRMDNTVRNAVEAARRRGTSSEIEIALTLSEAWRDVLHTMHKTVRLPNDANVAQARAALERFRRVSADQPFSAEVESKLAATEPDLAEYVEISKKSDALVISQLNELGFQTGGIAETSRIASNEQLKIAMTAAERNLRAIIVASIVMLIAVAAVGFAFSVIVARGIARPLSNIKNALSSLSRGDAEETIPETHRRDEIGEMALATEVFRDTLLQTRQMEKEAAEANLLQRDATQRRQLELVETVESSMRLVIDDLCASADRMCGLSSNMKSNADDTRERSLTMAAAVEESSASVSTVAAAIEEMASSLAAMSTSVRDVASRATDASSEAQDAELSLDALQKSIADIIEVVDAINAVADQTNLLALNATIEAARAGEAGKGFAVVASEVKALADQTRKMTEVISSQVSTVEQTSQKAIERTRLIVEKISNIDNAISSVREAVEQQNSATLEISRAAQDASSGSTKISSEIQFVQQSAHAMQDTCGEAVGAATAMSGNAAKVKSEMSMVLNSVRQG